MKFPEKPIATAGLGVVCALALLALLSWPGLLGSNPNYPTSQTSSVGEANQPSSTTSIVQSTTTSGSAGTPDNYSIGGVPGNISSPPASSTTAVESSVAQVTTVIESATTISASPVITQPIFSLASSQSSTTSSGAPSSYVTFAVLALVSIAIAAGSMLFMKRRINAE